MRRCKDVRRHGARGTGHKEKAKSQRRTLHAARNSEATHVHALHKGSTLGRPSGDGDDITLGPSIRVSLDAVTSD